MGKALKRNVQCLLSQYHHEIVERDLRKRDIYLQMIFFAANTERIFYVKGKCKASMKREVQSIEVGITDIIFAKCSCPAGESGYCNHSLHQLISIPEEKACTSMARKWGISSANPSTK